MTDDTVDDGENTVDDSGTGTPALPSALRSRAADGAASCSSLSSAAGAAAAPPKRPTKTVTFKFHQPLKRRLPLDDDAVELDVSGSQESVVAGTGQDSQNSQTSTSNGGASSSPRRSRRVRLVREPCIDVDPPPCSC